MSEEKPAEGTPAPVVTDTELTPAPATGENTPSQAGQSASADPVIDPELMDLPAPPHHRPTPPPSSHTDHHNGTSTSNADKSPVEQQPPREPGTMGIIESIASAPDPRPTDFQVPKDEGIDLEALENAADDMDIPGSPTAKLMRAIAPPNATQPNPNWPPPPPNASVNLFIGRALLSNGNDNWPLKPNDIVNWIRKHYPSEWDGDEGRCSAHRVRTYLARKGADMYYEKLNQGCIAGWRIRQNHLWRFENGGFQGRGMKQEEAIANAAKENEAIATAARKEAAALALAQGHPSVKVSMSEPGISDGAPPPKKAKAFKGQSRRRNIKKMDAFDGDLSMVSNIGSEHQGDQSYYDPSSSHHDPSQPQTLYSHLDPQSQAGPSTSTAQQTETNNTNGGTADDGQLHIDAAGLSNADGTPVDMNMVQQAINAAGAGMDDMDMGIELPIEMQMHSTEHDVGSDDRGFGSYGQQAQHPYTPHDQTYGYTG
ncbi:hypothetical protein CI109_106896 [Kwoniella shandongensis]|uniref:Uncharacterized protein n=1 Tax=Kwoniella shandongensis TaxID=1734106 RepID=A0A5M6C6D2_9TREE|nr:uncharacterized protein CI109_000848 [Kwoniella shandongensis]KAA5530668.1 hypothetical protein CI109_000848 [Kwoniella shandongensis]